eukprot:781081-Amorphochlora_amoeboformis.AAC.1
MMGGKISCMGTANAWALLLGTTSVLCKKRGRVLPGTTRYYRVLPDVTISKNLRTLPVRRESPVRPELSQRSGMENRIFYNYANFLDALETSGKVQSVICRDGTPSPNTSSPNTSNTFDFSYNR